MASFLVPPVWQPLDGNGKPYPGAKLFVYEAGTTTDLTVYSDNGLTTAHPQPVPADSNGVFPQIYMNADLYKYVLKTSGDVTISTHDNVASMVAGEGGTLPVSNGGTGSTTATAARTALGAASQTDYTTLNSTVGDLDSELQGIGGSLGDMAAKDEAAVTDLEAGLEIVVKDDFSTAQEATTMNITDGTEYHSKAFTPSRADSVIRIMANAIMSTGSSAVAGKVGVFRTGTTAALEAVTVRPNSRGTVSILAEYTPGSTSAQTFSLRSDETLEDVQFYIQEIYTTV